jgi:hypothetical protein
LALILGEQGRIQESWALFKRAGSEAQAHANLAYVYTRWGDLEKAESHFSQALALDSSIRPAAEALIQVEKTKSRLQTLAARKGAPSPQGKTGPDSTAPLPPESQAHAAESAAPTPPAKAASQRLAATSSKPASRRDPLLKTSLAPAPEAAAEPDFPIAREEGKHPRLEESSAAKEARGTAPAAPPTVVVRSPRVVDEPESPSPFAQELVAAQQAPPAAPQRTVEEPPTPSSGRTVFAQKSRPTGGNLWLERGDFSVSRPVAQAPATTVQGDSSASDLHQPEEAPPTVARHVEGWRDDVSSPPAPLAVSHTSSDEAMLRWGGNMPTKAEQPKRQSLVLLGDGAPPRAPVRDFRRDGGDDQAPRPVMGAHGEGLAAGEASPAIDDEPLPLIRPGIEPAFVPAPVLYGRSEAPRQASPQASAEAPSAPQVAAAPTSSGPAPAQQRREEVMAVSALHEAPIITPEQWRAQQAGQAQPFTTDLFPTARPTWTPSQAQPQPWTPPPSARPVIR